MSGRLTALAAGQTIPYGGDRVAVVSEALAAAFREGDHLVVVQETGDLLHVPAAAQRAAREAVDRAVAAFAALRACTDDQITAFFGAFADLLDRDDVAAAIGAANTADVAAARASGRSTTRLVMDEAMRAQMVAGLRIWRDMPPRRHAASRAAEHAGWTVDAVVDALGVVGFVFEGRPNVFADAAGVVRNGNAAVFRIGSDALGTADAIATHALGPALEAAGLPPGTVSLVHSPDRAAGWALLGDRRLALAVARGSGPAVAQLGAVARQAGVPVSLHGTGGAWMLVGLGADTGRLGAVVTASLDRKVCNTLNVVCLPRARAAELVPHVLAAVDAAAQRRSTSPVVHVTADAAAIVPAERGVDVVEEADLAREWEWDDSPELTIAVVDDLAHGVALCNRWSPRFVVSVVSDHADEQEAAWRALDAPFVGDGFTRWVDGQYALSTPELGLTNWEHGRTWGRSGILSGDGVHTVRLRARFDDPTVHR
ncbi:MAG: aldehyde dehydrogenase family protein [Ilumatobacteraceae bacterium]|nr:aldehyde dehydrogenase family protein [Ilumatobacteraceae bacterium]